jgi:tetraacyldisaccharide 4'-kinase
MREPAFWWDKPGLASRLLWPAAFVYGWIAALRMRRKGQPAGIPVICVGNFTLGGAGKTPTVIALARWLAESGLKPVVLTRGYGGSLAGPLRVDPARHRASDVGDEPLLLAHHAPVVVAHDRAAGAALAREEGAGVLVMDDGLQNPSLTKDFALAVIDGRRGLGNAAVFPAGPLRAPLRTQLAHVQAILVVGKGVGVAQATALAREHRRPLFQARLVPKAETVKALGRKRVLAFAGIGDPEKLFTTLAEAGIEATAEESFPDHHVYTEADAERLLARAEAGKLVPLTTEKDMARLTDGEGALAALRARATALPVTLAIEDEDGLRKLVRKAVPANR